jgi:hypothetical protein
MKTFIKPWPLTAKDTRTKADNTAPYHTAVDGTKTTPKSEKALSWNFFFKQIMLLYKTSCTDFDYISSLLHPSKAHRICSVKMAGYFLRKTLEIFYSYSNYLFFVCFVWRLIWSRVGMLWRMGGWEYLKHFVQRKRTLVLESCLWARCLDLCTFLLPYMFSAFVKNTRCVLCCRQTRVV